MKFIPAIDLKDKKCVRLEQGQEHKATVYNEDPVQQAIIFGQNGCERIHIVDNQIGSEGSPCRTIVLLAATGWGQAAPESSSRGGDGMVQVWLASIVVDRRPQSCTRIANGIAPSLSADRRAVRSASAPVW